MSSLSALEREVIYFLNSIFILKLNLSDGLTLWDSHGGDGRGDK